MNQRCSLLAGALGAILLLAGPTHRPAVAAPIYNVTELAPPDGIETIDTVSANDFGDVVATGRDKDGKRAAFRWDLLSVTPATPADRLSAVLLPFSGDESGVLGVSNARVAVGAVWSSGQLRQAARWSALDAPPELFGKDACDLLFVKSDLRGRLLQYAYGRADGQLSSFLQIGSAMVAFNGGFIPTDLCDTGVGCGNQLSNGIPFPAAFTVSEPDLTIQTQPLPLPPLASGGTANVVTPEGLIGGGIRDVDGHYSPALWVLPGGAAPATLKALATPALTDPTADALVVGAGRHGLAVNATLADGSPAAFFYEADGTSPVRLDDLLSFSSGWSVPQIAHVNNLGRMIGWGWHNGQPGLCCLTPLSPQGLTLRITPDRDHVQPGERLGLTLQITGPVPPLPRIFSLACSLPGVTFAQDDTQTDGPSLTVPLPSGVKQIHVDAVFPTWTQPPATPIRFEAELLPADLGQTSQLGPVFAIIEVTPQGP